MLSRLRPILALTVGLFTSSTYAARWQINMTEGVTSVSRDVYSLHMLIFSICCVIGIAVFGVMFYSMLRHRKSVGAKASNFHESLKLEVAWTVLPLVILIAMAFPATQSLKKIYDTADADMDILVTGSQWKWKYEYLDQGVSYLSRLSTPREQISNQQIKGEHYLLEVDEPLVIPVGKKIRFLVTSSDVIHSWWVPNLAVKRDAIPGYVNEAWTRVEETGLYRGQCAELCGKDHGFMPIVVDVKSEQDFATWLAAKQKQAAEIEAAARQTFTFEQLYDNGEKIFANNCAACHGADGGGGVGPAIRGSAIAGGDINKHMNIVVYGSQKNPLMAAWGQTLDAASLAAVITFQRNAFGNNMGDMVQPLDIVNFKQQK